MQSASSIESSNVTLINAPELLEATRANNPNEDRQDHLNNVDFQSKSDLKLLELRIVADNKNHRFEVAGKGQGGEELLSEEIVHLHGRLTRVDSRG